MSRALESAKTKGKAYSKMNQMELVHLWANNMIPKEITKGDYVFNPTEIWYCAPWKGNTKIAEHRELPDTFRQSENSNNTSVVYLLQSFDNRGSYGSGLSIWDISRAIPPEKFRIHCSVISGKDTKGEDWFLWMQNEFHKNNKHPYNTVAQFKEVISNNRIPSIYNSVLELNDHLELRALDPETFTRILNTETTQEIEYVKYSGWGPRGEVRQKQKITFKPVDFKLETFFTEHEIEVLKMKEWRDKYDKVKTRDSLSYTYSLKEITKVWFGDPKEKELFCKAREEKLAADIESERLAELKRIEVKVKESLSRINDWREGKVYRHTYLNVGYTCLRLNPDRTSIISSQSMTIDLEEAKKALRLFRAKEMKHDLIQGFTYRGIQKVNIPYLDEQGEVAYRYEDSVICGCHVCPESEILAFLKFYNLNW